MYIHIFIYKYITHVHTYRKVFKGTKVYFFRESRDILEIEQESQSAPCQLPINFMFPRNKTYGKARAMATRQDTLHLC
jgi:hypothetical protein